MVMCFGFWFLVFGFPLSDFYWMKIEIEKSCLCITSSQLSCSLSDQVVKYIDLFSFPFLAFFILFLNRKKIIDNDSTLTVIIVTSQCLCM